MRLISHDDGYLRNMVRIVLVYDKKLLVLGDKAT